MVRYTLLKRLLRSNSRYKQPTANASNTNFQYIFNSQFADRIVSIQLQSASFMNLFPNIYSPNNIVQYTVFGFPGIFSIVIPQAQYTATELAAYLDTATTDFKCSYDLVQHRFLFEWDVALGDVTILSSSSIAYSMGLTQNILVTPFVNGYTASSPNMMIAQVYLQSSFLGSTRCLDTPVFVGQYIPLVTPVDISATPHGFACHYSLHESEVGKINFDSDQLGSIRSVDFQLTDEHGNLLTLPDNCNVDLVFLLNYALE